MMLFAIAYEAIGKWLRGVMLALAQPAEMDPDRKAQDEYYRFPPF